MSELIDKVDWTICDSFPVELMNEVMVWYGDSTNFDQSLYFALLSEEEKVESARYLNENQRHTWIVSHASLRVICAHYLQKNASEIIFKRTKEGKPYVDDFSFSFNLSHTDNAFLIANSRQSVGVDMEVFSASALVKEVADFCFSDQEKELVASSSSTSNVVVWTAKEAYLKAIGLGLVDQLPLVNVVGPVRNSMTDNGYSAKTFFCPNDEIATLVYPPSIPTLSFYIFQSTHLI